MKHPIRSVVLALSVVAISASSVLAAPPATATEHGAQVSAIAHAVDYVSGRAKGAAVSAAAKAQGAAQSAAGKAKGAAAAAAGKAKGLAGKAKAAALSEPGRLKGAAAAAAAKPKGKPITEP